MMRCVYKITNLITKDFYIGSTIRFNKRRHQWRDYTSNTDSKVKKDILKIGRDKFSIEPIEIFPDGTPKNIISARELEIIHELQPYYNTIGKPMNVEARRKISVTLKGRKNPESGKKISRALKKRHETIPQTNAEHKKKVIILETGKIIDSMKECAEELGVSASTVTKAIKRKGTVRKYHVKLLECRD